MTTKRTTATYFEQIPLSAVKALVPDPATHFHAVQFYDSPDTLCRIVGAFIGDGLAEGTAAALIVTPDHGARIEACLRERRVDVDALKRAGTLLFVDARETLNEVMVDNMPNPSVFRRTVGGLLKGLPRTNNRPIRAYGEMVDLMWKDGREAAAIRLETFWNQLATSCDFELLCGYAIGNFYKGSMLDEIRRQHTHVMPADGGAAVPTSLPPATAV